MGYALHSTAKRILCYGSAEILFLLTPPFALCALEFTVAYLCETFHNKTTDLSVHGKIVIIINVVVIVDLSE